MNEQEIGERARKLGMTTWVRERHAVLVRRDGDADEATMETMSCCVGFAGIDLAIAEAETWGEAWSKALRIVFSA